MDINVDQQFENTSGQEITLFNQEQPAFEKGEDIIDAMPVSCWDPHQQVEEVEGSKQKKRRRTSSEDVKIKKNFSLKELFKTNNIDELNQCIKIDGHEATLNHQELEKNLKGWIIIKRVRAAGAGGIVRTDQFYCHDKLSKRTLRSLKEVKNCIEKKSYHRIDSDNQEVSKVEEIKDESTMTTNIGQYENHGRSEETVKDRKPSKKRKPVTCSKCHNQGHNTRTCKGQLAICYS